MKRCQGRVKRIKWELGLPGNPNTLLQLGTDQDILNFINEILQFRAFFFAVMRMLVGKIVLLSNKRRGSKMLQANRNEMEFLNCMSAKILTMTILLIKMIF